MWAIKHKDKDSMGRTRWAYGLGFSLFAKNADQFRPPPVSAHEVILFFSKKEAESGFNRAKCNHAEFEIVEVEVREVVRENHDSKYL